MKTNYKKFLAVSTIFIIIGFLYIYISNSNDLNSKGFFPVALGSSLVSTQTSQNPSSSLGEDINSDIAFLTTLVSLKNINVDITLFSNKSFNSLIDNTIRIEPVIPGRANPFSPIDSYNIFNSTGVSNIVTNPPTQISSTNATLNGTINITNGVTDAYFKYGTTENMTLVTTKLEQSLVGTFIKNVSGLNPKTNYFFKACAKVNNIELCGEVVSFMTL